MTRYLLKRFSIAVAILLVMSSILFLASRVDDPREFMLGEYTSAAQWEAWGEELGLNRPIIVQYADWVADSVRIDFGNSTQRKTPARNVAYEHAGFTLSLLVGGLAFSVVMSAAAIAATRYFGTRLSALANIGRTAKVVIPAIPPFIPAVFLAHVFYPNSLLFPVTGNGGWSYVLPCAVLGMVITYAVVRIYYASLNDAVGFEGNTEYSDKGTNRSDSEPRLVAKCTLLNLFRSSGYYLPVLLAAVIFTELVFDMRGLTFLMSDTTLIYDLPLFSSALMTLTMAYVAVLLLVDAARTFVDPRVRHGASEAALLGSRLASNVRPVLPGDWPLFGRRPLIALTILGVIVLLSVCIPLVVTFRGDALGTDWLYWIFFNVRQALLVLTLALVVAALVGGLAAMLSMRLGGFIDRGLTWLFDVSAGLPILLLAYAAYYLWLEVTVYSFLYSVIPDLIRATAYPACLFAVIVSGMFFSRIRADIQMPQSQGAVFNRHTLAGILKVAAIIAGPLVMMGAILDAAGGSWAGWGGPIRPVQYTLASIWWTLLAALVLILTILSLNFLGAWLRERLDSQPGEQIEGYADTQPKALEPNGKQDRSYPHSPLSAVPLIHYHRGASAPSL